MLVINRPISRLAKRVRPDTDHTFAMIDRSSPGPVHSRAARSPLWRVLGNASLLAFASLFVISLAAGRLSSGLLWAGALLVFFAPALDRLASEPGVIYATAARRANGLRWAGLAMALAGAAAVLT